MTFFFKALVSMLVNILNLQILTLSEIDLDLMSPKQECGIRSFSSTFYETEQYMIPAKYRLFFIYFLFFNWRIIALQCYVSFCCTAK